MAISNILLHHQSALTKPRNVEATAHSTNHPGERILLVTVVLYYDRDPQNHCD